MQFNYFEILSGDPIPIRGVGHIRSPMLSELKPTTGIGFTKYNIYLNLLSWTKEQVIRFDEISKITGADKLSKADKLNVFDIISLIEQTRDIYRDLLSFFIIEEVDWNTEKRCFETYTEQGDERIVVGSITRDNFEDVRIDILQMNYVGLDKQSQPAHHSNNKAKELWERAQAFIAEQAQIKAEAGRQEDHPELSLGNIISKVCTIHPSYNHTNIYDLTVFQLYDTYFQISYMRSVDLGERVFCNHGGKKFKFEDWMKPIQK